MADLTITAASVVPGAGAKIELGTAGEALTAGQAVYLEAATGKWKKADCDSATAEVRQATGLALTGSAANQPVAVLKKGLVTIGATVVKGSPYFLSDVAGGIRPHADMGSGDYVCQIGIATSTSVIDVQFIYPNVAI